MNKDYKEHANDGGVYRIVNTTNGREYIGSTCKFKSRAYEHEKALGEKEHHCNFLQADFDKCGTDSFTFEVLEVVPTEGLDKKQQSAARILVEQTYIDKGMVGGTIYNSRKVAIDVGYHTWNEDRKLNQGKAIKEHYEKDPNARERAKENALNGLWKDHSADVWLVHGPTGEEVHVTTSLRAFAEARGLSYKSLHLLKQGKTKSCGGWHMKDKPPVYVERKGEKRKPLSLEHKAKIAGKMKGDRFSGVSLISPAGIEVSIPDNVKQFCRDLSLHYSTFLKLIKQECKTCSGWKLKVKV